MPTRQKKRRDYLGGAALLALVLAAYSFVIVHGGFIWDDPEYIIHNAVLRDFGGLLAIWIHPTSIPQYYPVVHTTLWIEYQLFGLNPVPYHVDNVLLHGIAVIVLWRVLLQLHVPGAWLAAAIFAVHPVHVESVAWATERKNVLSLVFYLLSLRAYLRFALSDDENNHRADRRAYFLSLIFFVLALLSKSVTCSLPAAILLIFYWRRGRITWRDITPLIPFFVLGLAMSIVTGTLEKHHVGASGREWNWTFAQRCLIAGRALWFYAAKLVWPARLTFIYPKWTGMSFAAQPWLILFPLAAMGVIACLWFLRKRIGRGPLVAVLFFCGTLLPALGFVNLYPMRYSFVADHFQYHASIGLIVLGTVGLARIARRFNRKVSVIAGAMLLTTLAILTWRQGRIYQNEMTLWQDVLSKNPDSWMAWGNLGDVWAAQSDTTGISAEEKAHDRAQATKCYARLLVLAPDQEIAHYKWAIILDHADDFPGALAELQKALDIEPTFSPAMDNMGKVLMKMHQPDQAMEWYRRAIENDPGFADARYHYGIALEQSGKFDQAIEQYTLATTENPDDADAAYNLGTLLLTKRHRPDLAIRYFANAVRIDPGRVDIRYNFAVALKAIGEMPAAIEQCRAALRIDPKFKPALNLARSMGG